MMMLDLSDDEKLALVRLLAHTIEAGRYPLSPRVLTLKAALAKLDPPRRFDVVVSGTRRRWTASQDHHRHWQ
jgi:hypothetical protein